MSMQQQITLTWFLLLSTTIYMTTGFTRDTHLKWLVQRTLHHDRIKHLPSDIRCSDIQNARIDADSGDCVCPRDHVFHFMKNGIASCLSEQTICKGYSNNCMLGYGRHEYKMFSNRQQKSVLRFILKSSEKISCSHGDGFINGSLFEWRSHQWKQVLRTNHFHIWENQEFNEVVLPKDYFESGLVRFHFGCSKSSLRSTVHVRILQNATYPFFPSTHHGNNKGHTTRAAPGDPQYTNNNRQYNEEWIDSKTNKTITWPQQNQPTTQNEDLLKKELLLMIIVGIVTGLTIFLLIIIISIIVIRRTRRKREEETPQNTTSSTFYDSDIVYANPASMNLSRKAENHQPRDVPSTPNSKHYHHYNPYHQEVYTTLERAGFPSQETYQTLTDHRNSTKEIMTDVDDCVYDCHYDVYKRNDDVDMKKEEEDAVYFETEEIYHDPNVLVIDQSSKSTKALADFQPGGCHDNDESSEPFYFQTDFVVDHKKAHRLSSILRLQEEDGDGCEEEDGDGCQEEGIYANENDGEIYANELEEEEIYVNEDELKSDSESEEEEDIYANSQSCLTSVGNYGNQRLSSDSHLSVASNKKTNGDEFERDFSSFTIV